MKLKKLFLALGLVLFIPGFAAANGDVTDSNGKKQAEQPCDCQEGNQHHHMMQRDWQARIAEREQKLLTWVNQYTPDKKGEWTKVLEEKKTLRNKWLSPEFAGKREQWKKDKMAQMEELKKQLDEGKITKEEFIKKAHGGKDMGHWKSFHDLKLAIEAKDDKQSAVLLNQLLDQYKQHNISIKEMLNK